jgi:DNA polymerase I-like protein with 3'-5' exonuclease and polymerase domains
MQLPLFVESRPPDLAALKRCLAAPVVAVDIETETRWNGVGPKNEFGLSYPAPITVIALAWCEADQLHTTGLAAPFDSSVEDFLKQVFAGNTLIVAHNAVFDIRQLSKIAGVPRHIWDTMAMARLLHPAVGHGYSLLSVAKALGVAYPERQVAMKDQRGKLHTLPLDTQLEYAQDDARLTLQIYEAQRRLPADESLVDWECRAVRVYCQMAATGVCLNLEFIERRLQELREQRDSAAVRLRDDGLLTPGSSQARARYLYETKGIPLPAWSPRSYYFTRAGRHRLERSPRAPVTLADLSTRSDVIESYMEEGGPYADRLRDLSAYMELDWLISTMEALLDHAALDGRVHSLITIAVDSGRRASSNPQMQNWKMPAMAGVAMGAEGCTLVEIDYSNAENVMAALISTDNNLAFACAAQDFHSTMAARYFGAQWEQADTAERKRLRDISKRITFGTAYGMGAQRLGESIGVSTEEARQLLRAKDITFANVARARREAEQRVRETNSLELWTGRRAALTQPFVAWNYLCQGGVSEMLKRAIVLITEAYESRGMRSRVAIDMHDALILEIAHDEWDVALKLASGIMVSITPDELNRRTNPPIQWVAKAKIEENRRKWGAEQWHPE